jgi:hypothetical protein
MAWDGRPNHDGSAFSKAELRRYGESPPESNLNTNAPTMKASRIVTAIEVTGLTTMKIVRD